MIARTSGIAAPVARRDDVTGMTPTAGPLSSALTTWDVHGTPAPPDTNQTPPADNQVHEAIRRIPQVEQQIETFFATGKVVDTCGGQPCVEPVPASTPEAGALSSAGRRIPPAATCPQPHPPGPPPRKPAAGAVHRIGAGGA